MVRERRRGRGQPRINVDGSPVDAAVFLVLVVIGLIVLFHRKKKTRVFLAANIPIIIFFLYCLLSIMWSPFPGPAFKRWIKAIGDLVMVLDHHHGRSADCGAPATLLQTRLYSIPCFNCIDSLHGFGTWVRPRW